MYYTTIMTGGIPEPPAAPAGLSNGQITEGQFRPMTLIGERKEEGKKELMDRRGVFV